MYTVGLPVLAQGLFAAASTMIAIPSGIQVFAWVGTVALGRPRPTVPMVYVAAFVFTFVLGGITGVMVAAAPFDWQVHDSFFVVAHFHYVLLGGVLFPILGGLHHWFPKFTGRMPSERAGTIGAALVFVGFQVAFFPQHILGLRGMPRRVYTYAEDVGWTWLNQLSTAGSFVLGIGIVVAGGTYAHAWARGPRVDADPWGGDSLEWTTSSPPPPHNYAVLPVVGSRSPLWDEPHGPPHVDDRTRAAVSALAVPAGGRREVLATTPATAADPVAFALPGPSAWPFGAAVGIGIALVGVLVDGLLLGLAGVAVLLVSVVAWTRPDSGVSAGRVDDADVSSLRAAGRRPQGWYGLLAGLVSLGAVLAGFVYAYGYLLVSVDEWPPAGVAAPGLVRAGVAVLLALAAAGAAAIAVRSGAQEAWDCARSWLLVTVGAGAVLAAWTVAELLALPFDVDEHAYGAMVATLLGTEILLAATMGFVTAVVASRLPRAVTGAAHRRAADAVAEGWSGLEVSLLLAAFVALSVTVMRVVLLLGARIG